MKKILNNRSKVFMLSNMGFTLIELLAVIVILAIIAVIVTPIVLDIINDAKKSSTLQSAEFYIDALQNKIMQENMKLGGTLNPKECIIDINGNVNCDGIYLEVELNGQKPIDGNIKLDDGKINEIKLTYEKETVVMNSNGELQFEDNLSICRLIKGNKNEIGSKYECEVKEKTKYNFFVLSYEKDGTTNLIMDRNVCEDGTVATSINACLVSWNSSGDISEGPETAMEYLNKATSKWENIPNLNIVYDDEDKNFTGFIIKGKARLPRKDEVHADDKCLMSYENNDQYGSCPIWLVNYLNNSVYYTPEKGKVDVAGIWGYWTLSTYSQIASSAFHVHYYGDVGGYSIELSNHLGVRPVINIKL